MGITKSIWERLDMIFALGRCESISGSFIRGLCALTTLLLASSYLFLNICVALFTIVAIELIIRWNHISNAYSLGSTSQIIPLVIGVGNLWKVILSLLNELLLESSVNIYCINLDEC